MSIPPGVRYTLAIGRRSGLIAVGVLCLFARSGLARPPAPLSALAQAHAYRHGVVPMLGHLKASVMRAVRPAQLRYEGGVGGVGVITGAPRVDLVFWGSQWGSQATNNQGDVTLSGDPRGMAPDLQEFMKGLGTAGESWSSVLTQYCQGVAIGALSCPASAAHIAYPAGGVLAGVWVDGSSAAPPHATGHQIGREAVSAAAHFAPTQTGNGSVQYVIVSPPGTHPDGFNTANTQFCAWHDSTGDSTLSGGSVKSPYGQLPFTNLPYVPDAGAACGRGFVNSGAAGALDGVTIVEGHEYAETLTDPLPPSGWIDSSGNENGDKCAWITSGPGASKNLTLSTGAFAVQSTWANDANGGRGGCETSHATAGS
jgi:hypothetical protein